MTPTLKHLILGIAMLATAGLAVAMKPTEKIADKGPKVDLEAMIPKQFGDWKVDEELVPLTVNPELQAKLDKIYNQTLSRTYVNAGGERIMLSLAYGGDQSDGMSVHKPEVCYPAQGFQILSNKPGKLPTQLGEIPVKRLLTSQGSRIEPITYWITVGDEVVEGQWSRKLAQMKFGLTGKVPDGLLFRVSSINPDSTSAYQLHESFVNDLLGGVDVQARVRLVGKQAG